MSVTLILHDDLAGLTARQNGRLPTLVLELSRRSSVKDFLEALGIPHTEIDRLTINGTEADFAAIVGADDLIEAHGPPWPVDLTLPTRLRPEPLPELRFAVDANVGRLAGLLRMAGFDTFYERQLSDRDLAALAAREQRVLLTRDFALLKRREVVFGRLIRAAQPYEQLAEVVSLYGLSDKLQPFSRCLRCNTPLLMVAKADILERLEPLTRRYFHRFKSCPDCRRIYWAGSHQEMMLKTLEKLRP
ncbi:MAG TPA: Mut7-C RNAse domain-containing protein [Desulfurivibrionaceae bacterium]|nr:Mut7-C RNAse domain-containing protein [Desulfurivibrionaceae bacterium]